MLQQAYEFIVELGHFTVGLLAVFIWTCLILAMFIELIDFLIVDPIRRTRQPVEDEPTPVRKQIDLPQSGAPRDVR